MTITYEMREGSQKQGLEMMCGEVKNLLGDNLKIVEIGSYCGSGSIIISDFFPDSKLYCVDPWTKYHEEGSNYDIDKQEIELQEAERIFDSVIADKLNITKKKMYSSDYVKKVDDETIDFVYIDGNHGYSFVKEDITNWFPKLKNGGILGGHDYGWSSVRRAIKDVIGEDPYMTFIDGSWFFIK